MMRSSLTRNVFRQILNNEPYIAQCPHHIRHLSTIKAYHALPSPTRRTPRPARWAAIQRSQRRTLFGFSGFSRKPARVLRPAEFAPGLLVLNELRTATNEGSRLPERQALIEAWDMFTKYKITKKEPMNSMEVPHFLMALEYLRNPEPGQASLTKKSFADLEDIMAVEPINEMTEKAASERYALAKMLAAESDRYLLSGKTEEELLTYIPLRKKQRLVMYLKQLIFTGHTDEALDVAEDWTKKTAVFSSPHQTSKNASFVWTRIIQLIIQREMDETTLKDVLLKTQQLDLKLHPLVQAAMVKFYAKRNDFDNVKYWYEQEVYTYTSKDEDNVDGPQPAEISNTTLEEIFKFCSLNDRIEWGNTVFKAALNSNPDKLTWDALFLWVAAAPDKGVEDIERMITVMKKHNADRPDVVPDITTFNGLTKYAMSKNDPYLAERYLALALKLGIYPDAQTYILQMNYRIDAGDLPGVLATYSQLQAQEIKDNEDIPVLNKYIRALCNTSSANYNQISAIVSDLDDRESRFEPATVTDLCLLYLRRDELENVVDLCNTHAFHFTKEEREPLIQAFVDFIYDRRNDDGIAYEAYTILRTNFDEIARDLRAKIMREFFSRGRSDMGLHAFGHMRQHPNSKKRPTLDEYVSCFEGIAAAEDISSLATVHNMMKLDSSIDTNTTLYNALMMAYTSCNEPYRALNFWHDITISSEGPNYRSLEIVFYVCEKRPFGDETAKDIWSTMKRMEIEITRDVFSAYVDSLSGHAKFEEAFALVEGAEAEYGIKPDATMLGTMYNASPGMNRKDVIQEWAERVYPKLWKEMQDQYEYLPMENEFRGRLYKIPRNVKA